jgi:hypothetical protein
MRFEDRLEIGGHDAAGTVTAAQAFGFAPALVAFHVGGDASAVAAEISTGKSLDRSNGDKHDRYDSAPALDRATNE